MIQSNKRSLKDIIFIFLPVFIAAIIQYAVMLGDALVIFLCKLASDERRSRNESMADIISEAYSQPMNRAYITLLQYALFIICFGLWYYRVFCTQKNIKEDVKGFRMRVAPLCIIAAGYLAQIFVDCALELISPAFPDIFDEYDSLVSSVTGAQSSALMVFSVIILAPIGEELLFRGVVMRYASRVMAVPAAVLLQAMLFGLYHGNIVQVIYASVLGVVIGAIASRTGSIIYGIIFHMAVNLSIFLVPEIIFDKTTTTIIAAAVSFVVFVILLIWILRRGAASRKP